MIGRILLVAVAVALLLAMIGRRRVPKEPDRPAVQAARKCPGCGAYVVGDGGCATPGCSGK